MFDFLVGANSEKILGGGSGGSREGSRGGSGGGSGGETNIGLICGWAEGRSTVFGPPENHVFGLNRNAVKNSARGASGQV